MSDCGVNSGATLAAGFGRDRSSWAYVEHENADLADGAITTTTSPYLVHYAPTPSSNDGITADAGPVDIGSFASELDLPPSLRMPRRLDVAPDGAAWLPSNNGLARFGGRNRDWFLRGLDIEDIDIAADGTVRVQATEEEGVPTVEPDKGGSSGPGPQSHGTTSVFVITRQAVKSSG